MKRALFIAAMCISSLTALSQPDEQAIRKVIAMQEQAWNRGDVTGYMQGYWHSDSLLFVGSNGPTYGWKTTLQHYQERYPDAAAMGQLKLTILQLRPLSKGYCTVLGQWELHRSSGDVKGYFTLLFKRFKKGWLIVQDHSS